MDDWQTLAAPAVVIITAALFGVRAWRSRRRKTGACGGGCGCPVKPGAKR
jgi:hypothetical protein